MINTVRIQKYKDGEIVKTLQGKYQFIKSKYSSPTFSTVAELVKYESDKTAKRSARADKAKAGAKEVKQSTEKAVKPSEEQDDER